MTLLEKNYHNSDGCRSHPIVFLYHVFETKNKNENMEYHDTIISWALSLVVNDLCFGNQGSWFQSGCYLCEEVSCLQ